MRQNSPFAFWFVGFGITAAAVIVALAIRQARQRTRDLAALAQNIGFTFLGEAWHGPKLSSMYKTSLLQRTRGGFSNVMIGRRGEFDVGVFDYSHGQGKSRVTLTLVSFSQDAELPPFELRPENIFDKIGDAILQGDIDFDSNPEFSRRYRLGTPNEARIRMLFDPSLMNYFEQIPPDKKWHVEASGPSLIIYCHRVPARAAEIPTLLNEAFAIAKTVLTAAGVKTSGV